MQAADHLPRILEFLHRTGIETSTGTLEGPFFTPGIHIKNGKLVYDPQKLLYPGDLLHEAGHIAVTPAEERPKLSDNVDPTGQSGYELAAILWSYAAALAMDLPPEVVFHPAGYKGDSKWLIDTFNEKKYPGLPLLVWMGMTADEKKAEELGISPFPGMIRWLRE
jgi:hypothetical protein